MPGKIPAIISGLITALLLVLFGLAAVFFEMVALNGFNSDRLAAISMGTSLACQSAGGILTVILVPRLTNLFIIKFNGNKILAVVASVVVGVIMAGAFSFISMMIAVFIAQEMG